MNKLSRNYDAELDGDLVAAGSCLWQGSKSGLYFWHDETELLSSAFETLAEATADLNAYAVYLNTGVDPRAHGSDLP